MRKLTKNYFLCQRGSDLGSRDLRALRGGTDKQGSPSLVVLALNIPDILIDRE
jgi:hypothetical protein